MRNNQPVSLTIKEAIEQGYTNYVEDGGEMMAPLIGIEFDLLDFDKSRYWLMDKEPKALSVSPEDIYEGLAENFAINQEVADDDDSFGDIIRDSVDWQAVADKINIELAKHKVYFPTKIKLLPNGK